MNEATEKAPVNQSVVAVLCQVPAERMREMIITKAGEIAISGYCTHGKLCWTMNVLAAAKKNAGPFDSDNDTHRYWRRSVVPLAHRLCSLAEIAYDKTRAA
jgi:hypothetical protein